MIDWSQVVTPEAKAEQATKAAREAWKAERTAAVSSITVTTAAGNTFDGDETSQARMARAIIALPTGGTVVWVLADKSIIEASADEMREALALAVAEQARLWVSG